MQATVLDTESPSTKEIIAAGEQALIALCNGKPEEKTGFAALKAGFEKVFTSNSFISPQTFPLVLLHCPRVCFPILEWRGFANEVSPLDRVWKRSDGKLMPVLTYGFAKVIRCN